MNTDTLSYNELKAHYIAVRQRLGGLGKPAGLVPIQAVKSLPKQEPEPVQEPEVVWRIDGLPNNNFAKFLRQVAEKHNIDPKILMSNDRRKNIVMIRREVIWGAHKTLNYSQSQIARWLKKDHTSINHAVKMWEKQHNVGA
jgi:hypothetical protein